MAYVSQTKKQLPPKALFLDFQQDFLYNARIDMGIEVRFEQNLNAVYVGEKTLTTEEGEKR